MLKVSLIFSSFHFFGSNLCTNRWMIKKIDVIGLDNRWFQIFVRFLTKCPYFTALVTLMISQVCRTCFSYHRVYMYYSISAQLNLTNIGNISQQSILHTDRTCLQSYSNCFLQQIMAQLILLHRNKLSKCEI